MTGLRNRRPRRSVGTALVAAAFLVALGGCTLLPPPRAREVFVQPGAEEALSKGLLVLEAVTVDAGVASPRVRENALYIYELFIGRTNADRAPEASPGPLRVVVSVREAPFVSGFETKNAVSVETRVFDGPPPAAAADAGPRPIVIALYSEETESTIASYRYLHEIIEKSLSEVFR